MKKNWILIVLCCFFAILSTIFATLYFMGNGQVSKVDLKKAEIEKFKTLLKKEGYVANKSDSRYTNEEINKYYDFNDFIYCFTSEFNGYSTYDMEIKRCYYLLSDHAMNNVIYLEKGNSTLLKTEAETYDFKTRTGTCSDCNYLIEFKNDFTKLLLKGNIDIELLK